MITRVEVDGFKSLRDFAIDLDPFTVLIGPNSAGKSNVLDALALLSRLTSMPIAEAFRQGRGKSIDQFSRYGAEVAGAIRFAVEFLECGVYPRPARFQSRFRYELTIERRALPSGVEKLVVRDERLRAVRGEDDAWIAARPELAAFVGHADGRRDYFFTLKKNRDEPQRAIVVPSGLPNERSVPPTHTALCSTEPTSSFMVKANLRRCRMLDPWASRLGEPSERIDAGELASNASNLPAILAELPPNVLGEIRADLASLVPGVASFDVHPEGDEIRLDVAFSGGERMPARLVSAGTLRILALLTALRMEPRAYLLGIEEPESGIYPGRFRALLALLLEATTRSHESEAREELEEARRMAYVGVTLNQLPIQILLTTHSPVALAALRARPQHLRFVDMVRRDGERVTRVRTVGEPAPGDRGQLTIAPRDIDVLLQAAESEQPL